MTGMAADAQSQASDDDFVQKASSEYDAFLDQALEDYADFIDKSLEEYDAYLDRVHRDYEEFVLGVQQLWGGDSIVDNTQKQWVEYSDDYSSRSVVDFEAGTMTVEVLVDPDKTAQANQKLEQAIEKALGSRGSTNPYGNSVDERRPLTDRPVLNELVDLKAEGAASNSTTTASERRHAAQKVTANAKRQTTTVQGADGKKRTEVSVTLPLVKDNLSRSAALYKDIVAKYSRKYNVEQPLIFAVIEQESAFNPQARSHVPAYGLMQLVPTSGGRDAYRKVTGRDEVPHHDYLYDPDHNIQLGTAYLRILLDQFGGVRDGDCRRLCAIASYNTGAGNVSRAFTGATRVAPAVQKINTHSYASLYQFLTTKLQYAEARNYVAGVVRRREKYMK